MKVIINKKIWMAAVLGVSFIVAAPSTVRADSGDYCREYTRTVYIGGQRQEAYGTACLRPDGQWEVVNESKVQPVSYQTNRTVYVREPSQIVYTKHRPTKVVFVNSNKHKNKYYKRAHYRYDWRERDNHHSSHHGHR